MAGILDTFLLDLDGTLVDSVADLTTAVNALRAESSLPPLDLAQVRTYVGDGARLLVTRALPAGAFSEEKLARFLALYRVHLLDQTRLYPGIASFLRAHAPARMAVVTNKPTQLSGELLAGLGLERQFAVVLGGDSCATKKPDPQPVLEALHRLGARPEQAVMIGDHHTDLRAGRAAGTATCFCAWGLGHDDGLEVDFRATHPEDLLRLFPGVGV
ncbi:phosphoglycolate phosphatase [Geoalkalibacter ferrihydriticus]|uniref:phosphoglycolate phosphatase n=2 Tax=Geoalkalibacter ferrihydriticus TaxID=392333 RepID=A0A0C2ECH5_9BACT|nr:HAD-IA family hydrolase [Geoalkalibacter ferrihydriticus]KIH76293.1 HAD family hydrolase [Geoalkalibacter ferrihydriticus DSM 17813]SDL22420.1 phosphoglycolate phosphatase [Geoalkalibacter ferrihydriticus]